MKVDITCLITKLQKQHLPVWWIALVNGIACVRNRTGK